MEWCDVLVFTNDFLQATRTICANCSQGNQVLFGENASKQCVTMSLTAVIYHLEVLISIFGLLPLWIIFLPLEIICTCTFL